MSLLRAFEGCLACELERGEVTRAQCALEIDRKRFALTLECELTEARAHALVEAFVRRRPPEVTLIQTAFGAQRWTGAELEEAEGRCAVGVCFVVDSDEPLAANVDLFELVLARFGVRLMEGSHPRRNLQVHDGLAAMVRARPELYVGPSLDPHDLVDALLRAACLGWWQQGSADRVDVRLSPNGTVVIEHEGAPFCFDPDEAAHSPKRTPAWHFTTLFGGAAEVLTSVANALASCFLVESSVDGRAYRQAFVRGRPLALERLAPWSSRSTRISFTPDLDLLEGPLKLSRLRESCETLAALRPGKTIQLNDEAFAFHSLSDNSARWLPAGSAASHVEHCFVHERFTFRCLLGLSPTQTGRPLHFVNLTLEPRAAPGHVPAQLRAVSAALVDAVRLAAGSVVDADLVGVSSLEVPGLDPHAYLQLSEVEVESLRRSLQVPFAVFLDGVPGARELLASRWREAARPARPGLGLP